MDAIADVFQKLRLCIQKALIYLFEDHQYQRNHPLTLESLIRSKDHMVLQPLLRATCLCLDRIRCLRYSLP